MGERIFAAPVRLTGTVHPEQLAGLLAIDALVRRRSVTHSPESIDWALLTSGGDAAVQRAVERAMAREGDNREELGRDRFHERARQLESEAAAELHALLADLRIQVDMETWSLGNDQANQAARIAFVRLYDAGVVSSSEAVLDSCPNCETVVDEADADTVEIDCDVLRLGLPVGDDRIEVSTEQPELWVGAVAVAVPSDSSVTAESLLLPLLDREVPIVRVEGIDSAVVIVPGHDRWSHDFARQLNLPIVEVLDGEGIVRFPGLLEGLGRFAARSVATAHLLSNGFVIESVRSKCTVQRCYRCATVLVPLFGRHWLLNLRDLAEPVRALVENKQLTGNASAIDRLVEAIDRSGLWCLSQQLWTGQPIPVSTCLDCGQTKVSVEDDPSCGSCMGSLRPHSDVLDARFIGAVTPLAMLGWPANVAQQRADRLMVGQAGIETWALPIAALGLRLLGSPTFARLDTQRTPVGVSEPGQMRTNDLDALVARNGSALARLALLAGDLDFERANESADLLNNPGSGEVDMASLSFEYDALLDSLDAGGALVQLVNAARLGIPPGAELAFRELVGPLLGVL